MRVQKLIPCLQGNHFSNQYRPFLPEIGVLEKNGRFSFLRQNVETFKSQSRAFPPTDTRNPNPPPATQNRRKLAQIAEACPESTHRRTQINQPAQKPKLRTTAPRNTQQHQVRAEVRAITCCRSPCRADPSAASPTPQGPRPRRWPPPRPPWCRARGRCPNGSSLHPAALRPPVLLTCANRRNRLGPRHRPHLAFSLSLDASPRSSLAVAGSVRSCAFERGSRPGAGGGRLFVGAGRGRRGADHR